jgi:hypothetical protein
LLARWQSVHSLSPTVYTSGSLNWSKSCLMSWKYSSLHTLEPFLTSPRWVDPLHCRVGVDLGDVPRERGDRGVALRDVADDRERVALARVGTRAGRRGRHGQDGQRGPSGRGGRRKPGQPIGLSLRSLLCWPAKDSQFERPKITSTDSLPAEDTAVNLPVTSRSDWRPPKGKALSNGRGSPMGRCGVDSPITV